MDKSIDKEEANAEAFFKTLSRPGDSVVKLNYNKKSISVSNAFNSHQIPIKVIATYDNWLKFEEVYLTKDHIEFNLIENGISRPRKENLLRLQAYYQDEPRKFANEFYGLYIWEANLENPKQKLSKKHRGLALGKDKREMTIIKYTAGHLYVFFKHWFKLPESAWPDCLSEYLQKNEILPKGSKSKDYIISIVQKIITKHFKIQITRMHSKLFYDSYILFKKPRIIKRAYKTIDYIPTIHIPKVSFLMDVLTS
jgi:hypothetical protein